jgi:hypothetical protein
MTQPLTKNSEINPALVENIKLQLKKYYVLGLPLLKLLITVATVGLLIIGLYEYCSGGTAG